MTSIERTAYPRFKRNPTVRELLEVYTPSREEIEFARATTRGEGPLLSLVVMLKGFQRLGYFPRPDAVPVSVIGHISACLGLRPEVSATAPPRSSYRYQHVIREYLGVRPYDEQAQHLATVAVHSAAQTMDDPADLVNVAIEELVKERCELPASSTLDRLARHVRHSAYNGNNYLPLLWRFYRSHRGVLFKLVRSLQIGSTTQDRTVVAALDFLLEHEHRRGEWLPAEIGLDLASEQWRRTVLVHREEGYALNRRHLEVCVFSHLAAELRTGDLYVAGSEEFADYREQLLPWAECESMLVDYCRELGLESSSDGFVEQLHDWLARTAQIVDRGYPENGQVVIAERGEPVLKRLPRKEKPQGLQVLEAQLSERMPERNLLDILCDVEHWTGWTRHFGPLSGSDPKLDQARERYIITTFGYGCNLGPTQTARHTRGLVTPHMLGFVNRRHITTQKLEAAIRDIINSYNRVRLPKLWGTGKVAAADGTKLELYTENLLSEYHVRYGGYGGIAYHHVSDTYVALFTHFISCGVWEAVYIIDGLLKNTSDLQPDSLHADTQGQSVMWTDSLHACRSA